MLDVIQKRNQIDSSGLKFLVAEEMGECMDAIYADYDFEDAELKFYLINHKYHDGVGGFTRLLVEKEGHQFEHMPVIKKAQKASWFKRPALLWRYIQLTKKCDTYWKNRIETTGQADGAVFAFLTREQTLKLKERALQRKGSLNSLLCWALDQATQDYFLASNSERKWVCPVNMRGAVGKEMDYGNVAASIIMNLKKEESPETIRFYFRDYFKKQIHFGSWTYSNMARFIGLRATRRVAKRVKDVGVGVFSNMASWPQETYKLSSGKMEEKNNQAWAVAPPTSQVLPVSCAALEWKGQQSLALQLHPCLQTDLLGADQFMLSTLKIALGEAQADDVVRFAVDQKELKHKAQRLA